MTPLTLILTAANRAQARGYLMQLRQRERLGTLDQRSQYLVVPDPAGRRVGSGMATLLALQTLVARRRRSRRDPNLSLEQVLRDERVLIIHSGGDSRRLPAYAAQGKIFTPLPLLDHPPNASTLFDLILDDLTSVDWPGDGGVVVASGDVLLGIAEHRLRFADERVTVVAWPSDAERAARHGVFVIASDGRVSDVLQKPDSHTLESRGAIDDAGRVLLDLGIVSIPSREAVHWLHAAQAAGALASAAAIDLYAEMLPALANRTLIKRNDDSAAAFLHSIADRGLQAIAIPHSLFFHIGSTRELLHNVASGGGRDVIRLIRNDCDAASPNLPHDAIVLDSVIARANAIKGPAFINASHIVEPVTLAGGNVVVGLPAECRAAIRLPRDVGLVCLPIGEQDWTTIAFGIDDDFKTPAADESESCGGTFAGRWLSTLNPAFWNVGDDRTLWSARLWRIGNATDAVEHALAINADSIAPDQSLFSAATIMTRVNHRRLLRHAEHVRKETRRRTLANRLFIGPRVDAEQAAADLNTPDEASELLANIGGSLAHGPPSSLDARLLRLAAAVVARFPESRAAWRFAPTDFAHAAFEAVARSVQPAFKVKDQSRDSQFTIGRLVHVSAPIRIDLAGGWSDTPPICHEVGGAVVNIAVRLNGKQPISAHAKIIHEPIIRIRSVDLHQSINIRNASELHAHRDPGDWAALPKAALVLSGVIPLDASADLAEHLRSRGGGVELTISSDLPKGSGLGASSILGAATLSALAHLQRDSLSREHVIDRTSALEQMMSTAGGWQDQAGAVTPGIKLLATSPGGNQIPIESPLTIPADFWRERVLLYSTGMQRLARDILQKVVWRWLGGSADVQRIVQRLREGALRMREDLLAGDCERFARGVAEYWELKKAIDPGATTPTIDRMIDAVNPWLSACELPGAGGGGFLFMIARDSDAAARIRSHFKDHPPNANARFFDAEIDEHGLTVSSETQTA